MPPLLMQFARSGDINSLAHATSDWGLAVPRPFHGVKSRTSFFGEDVPLRSAFPGDEGQTTPQKLYPELPEGDDSDSSTTPVPPGDSQPDQPSEEAATSSEASPHHYHLLHHPYAAHHHALHHHLVHHLHQAPHGSELGPLAGMPHWAFKPPMYCGPYGCHTVMQMPPPFARPPMPMPFGPRVAPMAGPPFGPPWHVPYMGSPYQMGYVPSVPFSTSPTLSMMAEDADLGFSASATGGDDIPASFTGFLSPNYGRKDLVLPQDVAPEGASLVGGADLAAASKWHSFFPQA